MFNIPIAINLLGTHLLEQASRGSHPGDVVLDLDRAFFFGNDPPELLAELFREDFEYVFSQIDGAVWPQAARLRAFVIDFDALQLIAIVPGSYDNVPQPSCLCPPAGLLLGSFLGFRHSAELSLSQRTVPAHDDASRRAGELRGRTGRVNRRIPQNCS